MPHDHTGDPTSTPAFGGTVADASGQMDAGAGPSHEGGRLATLWNAVTAAVGAVMGLLPHLLHHISFLAGAALVTGVGGNLLFGALGLLLSVPLLRRLYRRFGTWKAPTVAVAVFAIMFSLSAFVIGPAISDTDQEPAPSQIDPEHSEHHD
ncbi:MAG TPA: hypothetical protein PLZ93_15635 [Nocardioides sp.]|uniref:hypothetical protein n=1 Tax=uncultured Nocardioides sp. TaxID=198441 RepID=UPI00263671CB|nr:hypothetical protein [uncultured Nocardioides sp.]HRI97046.1 hypothetical protein [Nocardioides sp.]HRK47026.1 hypothetical protein [Nocardioides sp.]